MSQSLNELSVDDILSMLPSFRNKAVVQGSSQGQSVADSGNRGNKAVTGLQQDDKVKTPCQA